MTVSERILKLVKQLYPTGRAWYMPSFGIFEALTLGLIPVKATAYDDCVSILDSILPDNDNFTEEDATDWERRYGMVINPDVPLSDRKQAIIRKMQFPGQAKARMSATYMQAQIQLAGFDVYVYENLIGQTPFDWSGASEILSDIEHGDDVEHGDIELGGYYNNKLVNHIKEGADDYFDDGGTFRTALFIGGSAAGSYANVSVDRKDEFRQLLLKLKGTTTICYLFIDYDY